LTIHNIYFTGKANKQTNRGQCNLQEFPIQGFHWLSPITK